MKREQIIINGTTYYVTGVPVNKRSEVVQNFAQSAYWSNPIPGLPTRSTITWREIAISHHVDVTDFAAISDDKLYKLLMIPSKTAPRTEHITHQRAVRWSEQQ